MKKYIISLEEYNESKKDINYDEYFEIMPKILIIIFAIPTFLCLIFGLLFLLGIDPR